MDKVFLEDLKRQEKYLKYFKKWSDQEFKSHPNEEELIKNLKSLSENLGMRDGLMLCSFDYRNLDLAFFAGRIEKYTGVHPSVFEKMGFEATMFIFHPEDRMEMLKFWNLVLESFQQISIKERHTFEYSYTTRIVHRKTKKETWIVGKVRPYLIDGDGNFVMDLHIILPLMNTPKIKQYDWNYSFTKEGGNRVIVSKTSPSKREVKLTKKEKVIVDLMLSGAVSKEISQQLNISVNTVGTHRKNILRKLGARNIGEVANILASYDF